MKEIDWANLSFGYMKTDYNVRCYYRDGAWGELELCSEETLNIHMAATCLHYGQEAFEGLKAYRGKDGKIRIFRPEANAQRLQSTCNGILMPELPTETFLAAVKKVVKANERFIPPYESGASLYIRPLLIGTGAQVGVHPANEYMFVVFVTPVGPYFKGGFSTNPYVIIREFDRAAPYGTGRYKVGGNYAASLRANKKAHDLGYSCEFYLDAKEKKYIDECGAANFFGNAVLFPKKNWKLSKKRVLAEQQPLSAPFSELMIWKTTNRMLSRKMVNRDRFVLSCTQSCVPFSMVMNLILTTGLLFSINR